jgi:hypothetical protein
MVVECVGRQLQSQVNFALDLVESWLVEWLENLVESSFDSLGHESDETNDNGNGKLGKKGIF